MKLLISEPPLQVLPSLAKLIGLQRALFLQQLHYWLDKPSAKEQAGRRWVYNTYEQWHEQLPFWTVRTIKRIVAELVESGLVLKENFNSDKRNRTMWYTIDYKVLDTLYDEGFSKVRYGTMESDNLSPSTEGQHFTVQSDNLSPSARNMEARARLTETSYRDYTEREERAREENISKEEEKSIDIWAMQAATEGLTVHHDRLQEPAPRPRDWVECPTCHEMTQDPEHTCEPIPIDALDAGETAEQAEQRLANTNTSLCDYPDPNGWACPHETAAMLGLAEILGRPVKKSHPSLHQFVHEHTLAETLAVAQHFVTHEKDISKHTVALIYYPDNAEARLLASKAPPEASVTLGPKPPLKPGEYVTRRVETDWTPPEPPPDDERIDTGPLMAELTKKLNANQVMHAQRRQRATRKLEETGQ